MVFAIRFNPSIFAHDFNSNFLKLQSPLFTNCQLIFKSDLVKNDCFLFVGT